MLWLLLQLTLHLLLLLFIELLLILLLRLFIILSHYRYLRVWLIVVRKRHLVDIWTLILDLRVNLVICLLRISPNVDIVILLVNVWVSNYFFIWHLINLIRWILVHLLIRFLRIYICVSIWIITVKVIDWNLISINLIIIFILNMTSLNLIGIIMGRLLIPSFLFSKPLLWSHFYDIFLNHFLCILLLIKARGLSNNISLLFLFLRREIVILRVIRFRYLIIFWN